MKVPSLNLHIHLGISWEIKPVEAVGTTIEAKLVIYCGEADCFRPEKQSQADNA